MISYSVFSQWNTSLKQVFWHFISCDACKKELMDDSTWIVIHSVDLQRWLDPRRIRMVISQAIVPKRPPSKMDDDDFLFDNHWTMRSTLIGTTVQKVQKQNDCSHTELLYSWGRWRWSPLSSPVTVPVHFLDLMEAHLMTASQSKALAPSTPISSSLCQARCLRHTLGSQETLIEWVS